MSQVFISYRRSDSPDTVKLLYERLIARLPRWTVFYDHRSLPVGEPFPDRLKAEVTTAPVVLVVIGPRWLETLRDRAAGAAVDHVREEIRLALAAGHLVVPVPVLNTPLPTDADLAAFPDLLALPALNARPVRPEPDFDGDLDRLVAFLEPLGPSVDVGTVLGGKYKLTQLVGEGGMGIVFRAEQLHPKRTVAVKLVKPGLDTKDVLARFDAERQALALMNHPNIAGVIDAGQTPAGRPYFVMDFVAGVPITEYCDAKRLAPADRLALFTQVCDAVQHAHQKGIVHRDLKPSNVLVETVDGHPVPKVIDFGLAKALSFRLTDKTLVSELGRTVGTLLYSSPEQAAGRIHDIDTRTDVYSLGVLLYEMLAGSPPFTQAELEAAGDDAMKRLIREQDPPAPSTMLSSSNALPTIAASRSLDPGKLTKLVRGELDWIVMKALDKEPGGRYPTAVSFADDVQRYLAHEPITAGRPTALHRLRKFVRRHRTPVVATLLVFAALVAGIVGTTLGFFEAKRQEGFARTEWQRANDAAEQEATAKDLAIKRFQQLDRANEVVADLVTTHDPLLPVYAQVPPEVALARKLDAITPKLAELSGGDPLILAKLQLAVGTALTSIGEGRKALSLLEAAREYYRKESGEDDPATIQATFQMALCEYTMLNRPLDAAARLEPLTTRCEATFGPHAEMTGNVRCLLGLALCRGGRLAEGLRRLEEAVADREKHAPADDPRTLAFQLLLFSQYAQAGDVEKKRRTAEAILKRRQGGGVGLPAADPFRPALEQLTGSLGKEGHEGVLEALEKVYQVTRKRYGAYHPATCLQAITLTQVYVMQDKYTEALMLSGEAQRTLVDQYGEDHFLTILNQTYLAAAYLGIRKVDQAFALIEPCRQKAERVFGTDSIHTTDIKAIYAACLAARRDTAGAITEFREALASSRKFLGDGHLNTLQLCDILASLYNREKRADEATQLLKTAVDAATKTHGPDSFFTIEMQVKLAEQYVKVGEFETGFTLLDEAAIRAVSRQGLRHKYTVNVFKNLDRIYSIVPLAQRDQTLAGRRRSVQAWTQALGASHVGTLKAELALASMLANRTGTDEGLTLYDQIIAKHKAANPIDAVELALVLELAAGGNRTKAMSHPAGSPERRALAEKAVGYQREYIDLRPKGTAEERISVAYSTRILAMMCVTASRPRDAIAAYESLWTNQASLRKDGQDDSFFLEVASQLRTLYREVENYKAALDVSLAHYAMTKLGASRLPSSVTESQAELVIAYRDAGQLDEAVKLADRVTDAELAKLISPEFRVVTILWNLAQVYHDAGKLDRALTLYQRVTDILEKGKYANRNSVAILRDFADCCELKDDYAEGERWRRRLVILTRERSGDQSAAYAGELAMLGRNLLRQKKWSAAEPYLRETLALREKLAKDAAAWLVPNAKSMLGEALFRQGKLAEAGPLVAQGYEGLVANEKAIPPAVVQERIYEGTDRMVRHLVLAGKRAEAATVADRFLAWVEKQAENRESLRYGAACLYATCVTADQPDPVVLGKALAALEKCRDGAYFKDAEMLRHFEGDEDFTTVRGTDRFRAFVGTLRPEIAPPPRSQK